MKPEARRRQELEEAETVFNRAARTTAPFWTALRSDSKLQCSKLLPHNVVSIPGGKQLL